MPRRSPISVQLRHVGSHRLVAYAMLLFLIIALVQVSASLLFYEAIDREALHEDHARRVAELLVVSDRVHRRDPRLTPQIMSSRYLSAEVASTPSVTATSDRDAVGQIHDHVVAWEPALASRQLTLDIARGGKGTRDLVGSMQLDDGSWLNFRSRDISSSWPVVLRATAVTLGITLLSIGLGLYALHLLTRPLRRLSEAVSHLASDGLPIDEKGPSDVRNLVRSFNEMRARIFDLEDNQSRSFEAISHDLRTPLSRLKIASDFVSDNEISRIVRSSADEMEAMLMSLQGFLRAQHLESEAEPVDLSALAASACARFGPAVRLIAPRQATTVTYREPLMLALDPMLENALQYGTQATLTVRSAGEDWIIEIADDGPGIAEEDVQAVLDPFFRGDEARARDTSGFGLGIPTAHRLLTRFGGQLVLDRSPGGGLVARVTVPRG